MEAEGRIRIKWQELYDYMQEVRESQFFRDLLVRIKDPKSLMGSDDCFMLYAVVRHFKPQVCLETGTGKGKASSFILEAFARNVQAKAYIRPPLLITVERVQVEAGGLIPEHLRKWYKQVHESIENYVKMDEFKKLKLDLFLHDSKHKYEHQMWEFNTFWPKLRKGGVLCTHDVDYSTAFLDFVTGKYKMNSIGKTDFEKSEFAVWLKVSNFGFVVKR